MSRSTSTARQYTRGERVRRIAVFGISRSGKDYSINGAVERLASKGHPFRHVSMISTVHQLLGNRKLSQMGEKEKLDLIDRVRMELDSASVFRNIIVDEHYCFPVTYGGKVIHSGYVDEKLPSHIVYDDDLDRSYEVVFIESEIKKYEIVFYLDIPAEIVLDRFRSSEGSKRNNLITLEDVRKWILYEKFSLRDLCRKYSIPFVTLTDPRRTFEDIAEILSR